MTRQKVIAKKSFPSSARPQPVEEKRLGSSILRAWWRPGTTAFVRGVPLAVLWSLLACLPNDLHAAAQAVPASPPPPAGRRLLEDSGSTGTTGEEPADSPPRLLSDPFQEPRQLLRLLDIGPSELNSFVEGQAISPVDEEALVKILFRLPRIEPSEMEGWLREQVRWDPAESAPRRGEFYLLEGRARSLAPQALRPRLAGLFEFDRYYQVRIELAPPAAGEPGTSVLVCSRTVPAAWQNSQQLNERCRVAGMFLKRGEDHDNQPQFLFAAPRIDWLPDRVDPQLGVGESEVLLGQLGMDVSLFDAVRPRNGLPIDASERECFYALLQAAHRAAPEELAELATPMQLGPLLKNPDTFHGRLLNVRGTVQRITRVVVAEADIARRFGIDHYYQLDLLVPVGNSAVEIRSGAEGRPGPVYHDTFPFTCCCLTLPPAWQPLLGRTKISEEARLTGFFFKLWAYPNPYVATFDERQRQLSPMLMLHEPVPLARPSRRNHAWGLLSGVGFLVVLATLWGFVYWMNRSDHQHRSVVLRRRFGDGNEPDFEQLERQDR